MSRATLERAAIASAPVPCNGIVAVVIGIADQHEGGGLVVAACGVGAGMADHRQVTIDGAPERGTEGDRSATALQWPREALQKSIE